MNGNRLEVMKHLEPFVCEVMPSLLMTEDTYWQPSDFLPDMGAPDAFDRLRDLQAGASGLSDDVLVVLIGDMITEEALPSYSMWIAQAEGFDRSGEPRNGWGDWLRKWTAEENRHGDILNKYLYLTGRVNMREVEVTVQNLLSDGGDVKVATDPYKTFTYTSFQEIATQISHKNVAKHALKAGDELLARMCTFIAGDENRHARAYKLFFEKILEVDTDEAIIAFYDMMRSKITMPAMYMRERGKKIGETFKKFAEVAERQNIYTPSDYADILERLVVHWDIGRLQGLSDKAEAAQQYLCGLPDRYRKVAERFANRVTKGVPHEFSWLDTSPPSPEEAMGSF